MSSISISPPLEAADVGTEKWPITIAASLGRFFDAYVITIYVLTIPLISHDFKVASRWLSRAKKAKPGVH